MRVLFICGCMEAGRDGVGDYTRRLSGEIIRQGGFASIVALSDSYVKEVKLEIQKDKNEEISILRLPTAQVWEEKHTEITKWIKTFCPDWLSLQFVLYAFQKKGLPFTLSKHLKTLGKGFKWHIMFHELWVDKDEGIRWKRTILSTLQKFIIRRLLQDLRPAVIHTHLPIYKKALKKLGWTAQNLPLFSNIEKIVTPKLHDDEKVDTVRLGFFSQIGLSPTLQDFLVSLQKSVISKNKNLEIILIGGSKTKMLAFRDALKYLENSTTVITYTGFLSSEAISRTIQSCTLGITPLSIEGLGKSGSVAAFLEHGIPVAVPVNQNKEMPFFDSQLTACLLLEPDLDKLKVATDATAIAKDFISIEIIANAFIADQKTLI